MGRPRIEEVNYYEFKRHLQKASDTGGRIEKTEKDKWDAYIRDNKVNEVAMMHWGKARYEGVKGVIIDDGGPWVGFYVYSASDEAVLKWVRDDE